MNAFKDMDFTGSNPLITALAISSNEEVNEIGSNLEKILHDKNFNISNANIMKYCKENVAYAYAFVLSDKVSDETIMSILEKLPKEDKKIVLTRNSLSQKVFEKAVEGMSASQLISMLTITPDYCSKMVMQRMCEKSMMEAAPIYGYIPFEMIDLSYLNTEEQQKYVSSAIDSFSAVKDSAQLYYAFQNNKTICDEVKNELFMEECDIEKINSPTTYMMNKVYDVLSQTIANKDIPDSEKKDA